LIGTAHASSGATHDPLRLVEIRGAVQGSGYLIAPTLIITAWHVVKSNAMVGVRIYGVYEKSPEGTRWDTLPANVIWPLMDPGDDNDFALLKISARTGLHDEPVQWDDLPKAGEIKVNGAGFPDKGTFINRFVKTLQGKPFKERDTIAIRGYIDAENGLKRREVYHTGTFAIEMDKPRGPVEGWEGASGAAIFFGCYLVGVVKAPPARATIIASRRYQ
jgi:hypothetical protein